MLKYSIMDEKNFSEKLYSNLKVNILLILWTLCMYVLYQSYGCASAGALKLSNFSHNTFTHHHFYTQILLAFNPFLLFLFINFQDWISWSFSDGLCSYTPINMTMKSVMLSRNRSFQHFSKNSLHLVLGSGNILSSLVAVGLPFWRLGSTLSDKGRTRNTISRVWLGVR